MQMFISCCNLYIINIGLCGKSLIKVPVSFATLDTNNNLL